MASSTCTAALNPMPILIPLLFWLLTGPMYIRWLKRKMMGQFIREEGPQSHQQKAGTPTMGGLLILATVLVAHVGVILVSRSLFTLDMVLCWVIVLVLGLLGFSDDWLKVTKKQNKGISGWTKLACQAALGLLVGIWVMFTVPQGSLVSLGPWAVDLMWSYPVFTMLIVMGASNAYNLTDGLDGLAASTGFMTFFGLAVLLATLPSLTTLSMLMAGGCLGFWWFNRHPAKVFMGDTGSLALGGGMAVLAILGKVELYLLLLGGIYVVEAVSVMLQVGYFKLTKGKRLFKMSPIHHHFELSGWSEVTVVIVFALVQAIFSVSAVLLYNGLKS